MMQLFSIISYYINMIGITAILATATVVGALFYLIKVKKVVAKEEKIDTSHFKREDAIYYAAFDDVVSRNGTLDSDGMIVINENVYVGGITVRGFPYYTASSDERISTQVNSVAFMDVVDKPTSFRQSIKGIDLSHNIREYEEILKKIGFELMELDSEYQATLSASEEYEDDPDVYEIYDKRMNELRKAIAAKRHMKEECEVVIQYAKSLSADSQKGGATGHRAKQIMFSYVYREEDFIEPLTKEEKYLKAMDELSAKASAYGEALAACNFRSKRLSARELIGLMRKQTSPITGESLDLDELLDSSYTCLFVSSDSLVEAFKEKIGEEIYNQRIARYQAEQEEMLRQLEERRFAVGEKVLNEAYEKAMSELGLEG